MGICVVVVVNGLVGFCEFNVVVMIGGFCVIVGGVVDGIFCILGLGVVLVTVVTELSAHTAGVVDTVNGGSMVVVCNGSYCINSI